MVCPANQNDIQIKSVRTYTSHITLVLTLHVMLFGVILYVPINSFTVLSGGCPVFLSNTSTMQRLAQGQPCNTVTPLSIELVILSTHVVSENSNGRT